MRARNRARYLAHFQRMSQPRAEMLALMVEENLRLVLQPAESRRMDNPVSVPLELVARRAGRRPIDPPP